MPELFIENLFDASKSYKASHTFCRTVQAHKHVYNMKAHLFQYKTTGNKQVFNFVFFCDGLGEKGTNYSGHLNSHHINYLITRYLTNEIWY